jgi:TRAP-type mannitol/chloroaromatic compound transport system permease small subunit
MKSILRVIDSISEYTGRTVTWAPIALIIVMMIEVVGRYFFDAPTIWVFETAMMLGATIGALGFAYTHRHHGHVRVDVVYVHLPPRIKALLDVISCTIMFFPLILALIYAAFIRAQVAWSTSEIGTDSLWYPPMTPVRVVVFIGFSFFFLQGLANYSRDWYHLIRNKEL